MIRKTLLFVLLSLALSVGGVHAQGGHTSEPVGIDALCSEAALELVTEAALPDDEQRLALDALLRRFVTLPEPGEAPLSVYNPKPPAPGAVVFIDSPAGRYFKAIGVADVETCEPLQPTAPFPIGSNTKMFTAAVIFQLDEEGLLSRDDLVSDYLPDEIALFEDAAPITIDMLLAHTSGLPDYAQSRERISGEMLETNRGMRFAPEYLVQMAAEVGSLLFEPGAEGEWAYSNTGYIMLGQIIEQVTGKSFSDAVTERIIEPLGLHNTIVIDVRPSPKLDLPGQYLASPFERETSGWNFSLAWSAGNMVSTAGDLAVFVRALFNGALFQQPATLDAMLTRAAPGFANASDDYHYLRGAYYKHGFYGHGGRTRGTVSDVGYYPADDVVIITWANAAEAYTGRGIYYVGQVLGLTPGLDEAARDMRATSRPSGDIAQPDAR